MSCGHEGCMCGPDQPTADAHLPMADRAAEPDHDGGGGHDRGGCCGGHEH